MRLRPGLSWFVCLGIGLLACTRQSTSTANSPDSNLPPVELSKRSDARVATLIEKLLHAAPATRLTSQVVLSQGNDTPPPAIFQLSNQRFTLDSFVHQRVSSDRVKYRDMVSGLDVMAAMGNAEATRLSKAELEGYSYGPDMHALRLTIDKLPTAYWQSNIYTRWFDALRTLHQIPEGPHLPDLLRTQVWQRKQLNNQLASWAELRHDTILYVAQVYSQHPV